MAMKLLLAAACCGALAAAAESTRTIERSFPLPGGGSRAVLICGFNGSVRVSGTDTNEVRFSIQETLRAPSDARLERLRREIDVSFAQEPGILRAGVKGPWTEGECGSENRRSRNRDHDWDSDDVEFRHEFTVTVPRDARMELKTINGEISLRRTTGDYSLKTINGNIEATDLEGAGSVNTINGRIKAVYDRNPRSETKFHNINGKMDLWFQPSLDAEFEFKTLHGNIFTDFDLTGTPVSVGRTSHEGNRIIYRGSLARMRAGSGGPLIQIHTLNGEILIHSLAKGRP